MQQSKIVTRFSRWASLFTAALFLFSSVSYLNVAHLKADEPVIIDGDIQEWSAADSATAVSDSRGDATGGFDLTEVKVRTEGSWLYVFMNLDGTLNLQNGSRDDGTLQLVVGFEDDSKMIVDFRSRRAFMQSDPDEIIPWPELSMASLPTYASESVELRLDLSRFDVGPDDQITINFSGSDTLDDPITSSFDAATSFAVRPVERNHEDHLRIVSMNTLNQGSADTNRAPSIKRMLAFSAADIFCFQEERREDVFDRSIGDVIPAVDNKTLHTAWNNGCAVATYLPMQELDADLDRAVVVGIDAADSKQIVVVSVHLKCCGFAGSSEDLLRVEQAEQMSAMVAKLRDGDFGDKWKDAGIVITGDYNLVGSINPLEELLDNGLEPILLLQLADQSATTWRGGPRESFWPGRLDWTTYDADKLAPGNGFLIDTASHDQAWLDAQGLEKDDSGYSDHLMSVIDFQIR